jgi:sortase A
MREPSLQVGEILLWILAALCGVASIAYVIEAHAAFTAASWTMPITHDKLPKPGEVMGRLEIQEVGLSVPVIEGFDDAALLRGVGHITGTALPGGLGNLVLAGHRDTYFRPLRNIHPGSQMKMFAGGEVYRYQVDSTEVVLPDAVRVLEIGDVPGMTLITCYPFAFVGAAPKRFIVHAHLVSL